MSASQKVRHNMSSPDLVNYLDIITMLTGDDIKCYASFQVVLEAIEELIGRCPCHLS